MSKKTNTIIFMLCGTALNIIITIISFMVLLVLFSRFLFPVLPETSLNWAIPVIFLLSIGISFLVYQMAVKYVMKKIDMEKYFEPIFSRRRPPPRNN